MRYGIFIWFILITADCFSFVVLIDPGHGGKELGATSYIVSTNKKGQKQREKIFEKDLSLRLAKRVQAHLMGKYSVYLTRSVDRTVSLEERAKMADTVKADLFISIHFNSATEPDFHGFETYYLDNHKEKAIKKVENVENKDLHGEDKIINQILIDLVISKTVNSSKKLAQLIHAGVGKKILKRHKRKDRGVKPGLFFVLALSKRPGVLIEAGFMSHPKEIFKLKSNRFLEDYAKGIAAGIHKFYADYGKKEIPLF